MTHRVHRTPLIAQILVGHYELLGDGRNGQPVAGGLTIVEMMLGGNRKKRHQHQHQGTGTDRQDDTYGPKIFHRRPNIPPQKL